MERFQYHLSIVKLERIGLFPKTYFPSFLKLSRQVTRLVTGTTFVHGTYGAYKTLDGLWNGEMWEDSRQLLETKEATEQQRKSLKKQQSGKGDGTDADSGAQEDFLIQDEISKSRLVSIKPAYDLVEHRYVVCKLHGLNVQWSEDKKQSYIRHQ
uniref:Uncharacterized protein n=1 Tax=Populus trichocarpa TaxID=3694 RepID=A0A2K1WPR7_POPTR